MIKKLRPTETNFFKQNVLTVFLLFVVYQRIALEMTAQNTTTNQDGAFQKIRKRKQRTARLKSLALKIAFVQTGL